MGNEKYDDALVVLSTAECPEVTLGELRRTDTHPQAIEWLLQRLEETGKPHTLPLSDAAKEVLDLVLRFAREELIPAIVARAAHRTLCRCRGRDGQPPAKVAGREILNAIKLCDNVFRERIEDYILDETMKACIPAHPF